MGDYGPMSDAVEGLVAMVDSLDGERLHKIASAYRDRGRPQPNFSLIAAKHDGRSSAVSNAMKAMSMNLHLRGILEDWDQWEIETAAWAARNAGVALATEDLIGNLGYSSGEYGKLIDPWMSGFDDLPITKREEAA